MAKKNTAHRPSQAHQEYVTTKDGRKVRNTAYKPRQNNASASQSSVSDTISGEMASAHPSSALSDFDRAEAGLENLDSIIETMESGKTISAEQGRELDNFVEAIGNAKNNSDITGLLQSYGIRSIEHTDDTRDSLAAGEIRKQSVKIVSDDPNIPSLINKQTIGKNRYSDHERSLTTVLFGRDNTTDYTHMTISINPVDNDVSVTTGIKGEADEFKEITSENGDVMRLKGGVYKEHVIQPGSSDGIELTMWRDKDLNSLDKIDNIQTVHDAGMAQGAAVTYQYNDEGNAIVASWEEDGTTMYSEYEVKGKGAKQVAVPGQKRAAK